MRNIPVKLLVLTAAAVTPQLIALNTEANRLKPIETLSVHERVAIKNLSEKAVYNKRDRNRNTRANNS